MNWQGRRVLVTGGSGFIGSFLVEELIKRGAHVRIAHHADGYGWLAEISDVIEWMQGDLADLSFCQSIVEGIDMVFHLASCRRNVAFHHDHALEVAEANAQMSASLLNALQRLSVPVVFFSTANILPDTDLSVVKDGYIAGKLCSEEMWQQASRERIFPLLIIRPVSVYGPRDVFQEDGNVIPALIVRAAAAQGELTVWGSGKQERSFLYVEDVPPALFALLEAGVTGVHYIQNPECSTIADLAGKIRDLVHPELSLLFDPSKPEGVVKMQLPSMHRSLQQFSWTPLSEGLQKTVKWWRNHSSNRREDS